MLLPGQTYLLTLTAPGRSVHAYRGGKLLCPCTTESNKIDDPIAMAVWNGQSASRWNRLHQAIERRLGLDLQYFRVVEVQKRGALHLHVLVRVERPVRLRVSMLRALAMRHGFGHSVDVQKADARASWYCAKYVSKSSDQREDAPYLHPVTGELGPGRWRTWTATRRWGSSMAEVRAAQAQWWQERSGSGVVGRPEGASPEAGGDGEAGALDPNGIRYADGRFVAPLADASRPPM